MKALKNTLLVLSTGYIFVYFSEHLFWARPRGESPGELLLLWLAYSLVAYFFLLLVAYFRVKSLWALFLAGAAVGWLAEGVLVQTTYEMLPLSLSWTGLAWHALLTVWVGWYAVQNSFHSPGRYPTLKVAALVGLGAGVWAINWWLEPAPDGGVTPVGSYAVYVLLTTAVVMAAYWLANWSASEPFAPNRWATILLSAAFLLYFLFIAVRAQPLAIVILPALLALVWFSLRRNRQSETEGSLLDRFHGAVPPGRFLSLLAVPLVSIVFYALTLQLGVRVQTNWLLYIITTPLGFILLGVSLFKIWRKPRPDGSLSAAETGYARHSDG